MEGAMGQYGRRQCDNETCQEHSGMAQRMQTAERIILKIEERFYHILVSILLTMFATALTASLTVYATINARIDKMHEEKQKLAIHQELEEWRTFKKKNLVASVANAKKDSKTWMPKHLRSLSEQERLQISHFSLPLQ